MPGGSEQRAVPLLTRFKADDLEDLAELLNDPSISEFTTVPHPYTRGNAREW